MSILDSVQSVYLTFNQVSTSRKLTKVVEVMSKRHRKMKLGTIQWYGAWRQYVFYPEPGTLFNRSCLSDIESMLQSMNAEQRRLQRERTIAEGDAHRADD